MHKSFVEALKLCFATAAWSKKLVLWSFSWCFRQDRTWTNIHLPKTLPQKNRTGTLRMLLSTIFPHSYTNLGVPCPHKWGCEFGRTFPWLIFPGASPACEKRVKHGVPTIAQPGASPFVAGCVCVGVCPPSKNEN